MSSRQVDLADAFPFIGINKVDKNLAPFSFNDERTMLVEFLKNYILVMQSHVYNESRIYNVVIK